MPPRRKRSEAAQPAQAAGPSEDRARRKRNPSLKLREMAGEFEEAAPRAKRRKTTREESPQYEEPAAEPDPETETEAEPEPVQVQSTPKRKRGRPPKQATVTTPSAKAVLAETPSRGTAKKKDALTPQRGPGSEAITPRRRNAADRSARKKSMRTLMRSVVANESEDEEAVDLAQAIYDDRSDDSEAAEEEEDADALDKPPAAAAATPTKRGPGRPRRPQKSPTPPRDLPPHETYFLHNKPGRAKTSDNTLASLDLLTHDEYFSFYRGRREGDDPHAPDVEFLESLHAASFPQWDFELSQGFTVCLYGLGSKKSLLTRFAGHAHANRGSAEDRIVVANGYVRTITAREILAAVYSALDPENPPPSAQPALILQAISSHLAAKCPAATLTVLVNSIDAPPLRKPATQAALAHLASHPQVRLLCSADTPDFPLLWDTSLRSTFNFIFHDATTVRPLLAELDVVDDVHELLGRAARRAGGREAVSAVLKSLTQAARGLYALLLAEVMAAMDDDMQGEGDENPGIEYRILYKKAVESFVGSSSEMAFRQVLREFLDHQMITSRKDALGTELISVPFRREEMEAILEDIDT